MPVPTTVINTNLYALNAQRNLQTVEIQLAEAMQRLSSGKRINSAKDDASGIAIAARMTTQIRGLGMAIRGLTAEGGLDSITGSLQRIRELAVQAASPILSSADRASLQAEVAQLRDEITRVGNQTTWNGMDLLDGTWAPALFQAGPNVGDTINFDAIGDARAQALGVASVDVSSVAGANATLTAVDAALETVTSARGRLGAVMSRLENSIANLRITLENQTASRSRIEDADFAAETAKLARSQTLQSAALAILSQANALPMNVLSLLKLG
jgi:flagellin